MDALPIDDSRRATPRDAHVGRAHQKDKVGRHVEHEERLKQERRAENEEEESESFEKWFSLLSGMAMIGGRHGTVHVNKLDECWPTIEETDEESISGGLSKETRGIRVQRFGYGSNVQSKSESRGQDFISSGDVL
ncbi:unnamed protein product [Citrullus colocynthis]|uniref:Uncharacterized protein n=1 Tax=Citrullus colocynthis TaxID=252529 RepID=A0ABP0YYF0_9ROSI